MMTVREAADKWNVTPSAVHKWIRQGRVNVERVGGGPSRAAALLVLDTERPDRAVPNALTDAQRAAWPRDGKKSAEKSAPRPKRKRSAK